MNDVTTAALLGLVQGLTEFLVERELRDVRLVAAVRFLRANSLNWFIPYRVAFAVVLLAAAVLGIA